VTTDGKQKAVLAGVPRIGYDVRLCPFPGSLSACLAYMGAPVDYDYVMGVTGAAFRRFWNRDDGGNIDLFYLGVRPAQRILDALGYEWRVVPPEKPAMIEAIKESIGRGVPVIVFGIIGPPEAGLVTGYADDGETLYGWSYFQEGRDACYEKSDWFETMEKGTHANEGAIVIGEPKAVRPTERQVYIDALRQAVELECASTWPDVPDHTAGLAAYVGWADGLEVDADYPADNPGILGLRMMVHGDQCCMLEERGNAAAFLRQAAVVLPEAAAQLEAAADLYAQVQQYGSRTWPWDYTMGPENQQRLADPAARREIAAAIREAARLEAQAVEQLQKALAVIG
jgi:hypothetical protein